MGTMNIRALDLFCGGGGSSWGAKLAGVDIACGVDMWDVALETYSDNFGPIAHKSLITSDSDPGEIAHLGPFDIIMASPECTNHTCAKGNKPRDEESKLTASHVLNYLRYFRPRWAVIENVVHMRKWNRYEGLISELRSIGYNPVTQVIDASDLGVPQTRRRLFILCDREEVPPRVQIPSSSPVPVSRLLDPKGTWKTTPLYSRNRAQNTLKSAERAMAELPEDEDFLLVYYGSDAAGGWQRLNRPLRTLTTLDRFGLVERNLGSPTLRMLQVPELMRAMGFDERYRLTTGTRRDKVKLLGNGVCPPVMKAVIETLIGKSSLPFPC